MSDERTDYIAGQRLDDIRTLRRVPSFERYLMSRLREMRDEAAARVLDDDEITPEQREAHRHAYKALKTACNMPEADEATAMKILGQKS